MSRPPITTIYDDEGVETLLPTKWEICDNCRGNGTHVNPAIDGNGLSRDDPDLDEDFWDGYWTGRYDIKCDNCQGSGKVQVVDRERVTPEQLTQLEEAYRDRADYEAECAAERRMGA